MAWSSLNVAACFGEETEGLDGEALQMLHAGPHFAAMQPLDLDPPKKMEFQQCLKTTVRPWTRRSIIDLDLST
eukprot:930105-Prorocentrum_lima.AAC.1